MRDEFTCRSCARDTRRFPGVTVFDERSGARAGACAVCWKDRPVLALNALVAFVKGLPREVVNA